MTDLEKQLEALRIKLEDDYRLDSEDGISAEYLDSRCNEFNNNISKLLLLQEQVVIEKLKPLSAPLTPEEEQWVKKTVSEL